MGEPLIIDMAKYATEVAVPRKKLDRLITDWENLTDCLEWIVERLERGGIRRVAMEEAALRARETLRGAEGGWPGDHETRQG